MRKRDGWINRGREREKEGRWKERERSVGEDTLTERERHLLRWRSLYCRRTGGGGVREEKGERDMREDFVVFLPVW